MRTFLIIAWLVGLGFMVWEFVSAGSLPERYGKAKPNSFRIADIIFGAVIILTLYYLFTT